MKKLFLIPLLSLCVCISAWGVEATVGDLNALNTALSNNEVNEITLSANITTSAKLNITKALTINGHGYCIKGNDTYVFQVNTTGKVVMNDLVIWAAKTSKAGRGILINNNTNNADLTLNNVTINATYRAMDVWYSDGVKLAINNCTFQNVQGQTVDAQGNPTAAQYDIVLTGTNAGDTRGLNFGQLTNSTITINNSTMQGFFYVLNNVTGDNGDMTGTTLTASNSTFKGRAALNVWGFGGNYTFNDCAVTGINNYGSDQESFACFVFNNQNTCYNNLLTINGGTVVSAVFDAVGSSNPNARQFLLTARGKNTSIVVNNAQYSCAKGLGDSKGGIVEYIYPEGNYVEINDGVYDCPEIIELNYTTSNHLVLNGGVYNLNRICGGTLDNYPMIKFQTIHLTGGTFNTDMSQIYEYNTNPGEEDNQVIEMSMIAAGYKQVANANSTYSIIPEETETQTAVGTTDSDGDGVNDVNWNTAADWSTTSQAKEAVPDAATSVTIGNGTDEVSVVVKDDGAAEVYRVDLADKVTLTVKDEGVLNIGEGGIVAHENAQIVVEDGGTLVLNGTIQGTENVVIEASENSNTTILVNPDINVYGDEHPKATYRFTSKSFKDGSKWVYQRLGMPTYDGNVEVKSLNGSFDTWVKKWDYEANDWGAWRKFNETYDTLKVNGAQPFEGYMLGSNNPRIDGENPAMVYEFTGSLMGNTDANLHFYLGWNNYANSYTAPIDIREFITTVMNTIGNQNILATIYLYTDLGDDTYTWTAVNMATAGEPQVVGFNPVTGPIIEYFPSDIKPMQAFLMLLQGGDDVDQTIDYRNNVYNPALANMSNSAPARQKQSTNNRMSVTVYNANSYDNVTLIEGAEFSSELDNGYDAVKYEGVTGLQIYAMNNDTRMEILASDNILGTFLGVDAPEAGTYTLYFSNVTGMDYAVVDLLNNTVTEITDGLQYSFTTEAGNNDYRFQIVAKYNTPTGVEDIESAKTLGIYTMLGQYVGQDFNALPAGVYIVNGQKVVK